MIPKNIAIVGLGLIGGSLAALCRQRIPKARLLGISRNQAALRKAKQNRWVHQTSSDIREVQQADLIILCTPVNTITNYLRTIDQVANPGTLVTDVSSVHGSNIKWVNRRRFKNIQFVGSHPMAGSHQKGIQGAHKGLLRNAWLFAIRPNQTTQKNFQRVITFWKRLGFKIVSLTAEKHDRIVSDISHLPHALAVALMLSVDRKVALPFAATGFADTTRIAQGHPSIWAPIFSANQNNLTQAITRVENTLRKMKRFLKRKEFKKLELLLVQAAKIRTQISL